MLTLINADFISALSKTGGFKRVYPPSEIFFDYFAKLLEDRETPKALDTICLRKLK
jgi:hypothetical protein